MGALAHAVTVGAKLRGIVQTQAFVETAASSPTYSPPATPVKENPYREARERARMRRKIVVPESDVDLRKAVEDLLLLMNRAETITGRIADEEAVPAPAAFDTADEEIAPPFAAFDAADEHDPPSRLSQREYAGQTSGEPFQPALAEVGALAAASSRAGDKPLRIASSEPVLAPVGPYDQAARERVAAGLVTFHGGMTVPKVAPFILEPSAGAVRESED